MRRALGFGATLVAVGAIVMVVSFLTRQTVDIRVGAACIGVGCVFLGAGIAALGMQRALADDACIVVRTDGLSAQIRDCESFFAWDEITRISFDDAGGAIVIERRQGADFRVTGIGYHGHKKKQSLRELAFELDGMRRKASFKMLRA